MRRIRDLTELTRRYWSNGDSWHHLLVTSEVTKAETAKGFIIAPCFLDTVIRLDRASPYLRT